MHITLTAEVNNGTYEYESPISIESADEVSWVFHRWVSMFRHDNEYMDFKFIYVDNERNTRLYMSVVGNDDVRQFVYDCLVAMTFSEKTIVDSIMPDIFMD